MKDKSQFKYPLNVLLGFAILVGAGLTIVSSALLPAMGDLFAILTFIACFALGVRVVFRNFFKPASSATDDQGDVLQEKSSAVSKWVLLVVGVISLVGFYLFYLVPPISLDDINMESMALPLAVHSLEIARLKQVPAEEFFNRDPLFENMKQQDPQQAFGYPHQRFGLKHFASSWPVFACFYLPFDKIFGVTNDASTAYATFFTFATLLLITWFAWNLYGPFTGMLTAGFFVSSLLILINTKVAIQQITCSMFLITCLAVALFQYQRSPRAHWICLIALLMGFTFMTAWIDFGFAVLLLALGLTFLGPKKITVLVREFAMIVTLACLTVVGFIYIYHWVYGLDLADIYRAIGDVYLSRLSEGAVPAHPLSLGEKSMWGFRWMFINSAAFDHPDKYLEDTPAISYLFSALFFVGVFFAIIRRTRIDRWLLCWLLAVFGTLASIYMYENRYALMGLPAMAVIASRGAQECYLWFKKRFRLVGQAFVVMLVLGLLASYVTTYHNYYNRYLLHRRGDLELDRPRGHHDLWKWLSATYSDTDTLVILNDPITFASIIPLYNNFVFHKNYNYIYLNHYIRGDAKPEDVRSLEKQIFSRYSKIVYALTTISLGGPNWNNDPAAVLRLHSGQNPDFTYVYDGRLLIHAYVVNRG